MSRPAGNSVHRDRDPPGTLRYERPARHRAEAVWRSMALSIAFRLSGPPPGRRACPLCMKPRRHRGPPTACRISAEFVDIQTAGRLTRVRRGGALSTFALAHRPNARLPKAVWDDRVREAEARSGPSPQLPPQSQASASRAASPHGRLVSASSWAGLSRRLVSRRVWDPCRRDWDPRSQRAGAIRATGGDTSFAPREGASPPGSPPGARSWRL
jgi:hypothetical protein